MSVSAKKHESRGETWTVVLRADQPEGASSWRELWRYRDLVWLLFKRDFVAQYKQTVLGPLWFLLQPLLTTTAFTIVFSRIARIPTDQVNPFLFYMAGVVPWGYFALCLTSVSNSFLSNSSLLGKVYFPRLAVPVSLLATSFVSFLIQLSLFLGLYFAIYFHTAAVPANAVLFMIPLLLIHTAALGLGSGLIVASLAARYRDLIIALNFGVQLWMYATPIVYPLSQVPDTWRWLFHLNPMTAIIETFRFGFFRAGAGVGILDYLVSVLTAVIILLLGVRMFERAGRTVVDTI